MCGDIFSLRMLVVATAPADHEMWRMAAAKATIPIELEVLDIAQAAVLLSRTRTDICVLDADLSDADKNILIKAAHAVPPPLVIMAGPNGAPRPDGVDGVVARPANEAEAADLIQLCVRAKIPTRVLVVDDSGTMRSIVKKILQASHFALNIQETPEGAAAIERLRNERFGIVFLDYNMPGLNGFETLAQIRRDCPDVAVVMMTSTSDHGIADRAREAGALAFLKKPFFPADVDATLERYYGLNLLRS